MNNIKATEGYEDMFEESKSNAGTLMDNREIIGHLRKIMPLPSRVTRLELVLEMDEVPRLTVESHVEGYDCINAT